MFLFHHQVKRDESGAIHVTKQKHLHLYYDLINFTVSIQINYPHLLHVIVLRPWCVKAFRITAMNRAFRIIWNMDRSEVWLILNKVWVWYDATLFFMSFSLWLAEQKFSLDPISLKESLEEFRWISSGLLPDFLCQHIFILLRLS